MSHSLKQCPEQGVAASGPQKQADQWSMDFVSDQQVSGQRFRVLNVVDDISRKVVGQLVSVSISGKQVSRFLSQLIDERSKPEHIVCDNGTKFTSKGMLFWSKSNDVRLIFIQPGRPTQNAFVESLNGKFRNECLDQNGFRTLDEARYEIEQWQCHYNYERSHSSLNYISPVELRKTGSLKLKFHR